MRTERLQITVGAKCNNNCIFCMEEDRQERFERISKITKSNIEQMLEEKKELGEVIFTSGEPTLNPGLLSYIALAKSKGYRLIGLITNGRRLSYKSYCLQLLKAGLNHITVSLHSTDERIHESLTRTKGSFKQTMKGVRNLHQLKELIHFNFNISIVVNRWNINHLEEDYSLLGNLNTDSIILNQLKPLNLNKSMNSNLIVRYKEVVEKVREIMDMIPCPKLSLSDIPKCISKDISIIVGQSENAHIKYEGSYTFPNDSQKSFTNDCKFCKYFSICPGVWEGYLEIFGLDEISPVRLKQDKFDLNIGNFCNNNCKFCMSKNSKKRQHFTDIFLLKNELSANVAKELRILGGEPTIYPDLINLVSYAKGLGYEEIHIITNGRKLSDNQIVNQLVDAGVTRFSFSIHSNDPEIEDYMTDVKGGWEQKIRGLKNVLSLDKIYVFVNIVLNKYNIGGLYDTINYFFQMGVKDFRINSMMSHSGNAKMNKDEFLPKFIDCVPQIEQVLKIENIRITLGDFPPCVFTKPEKILCLIGEYNYDEDTVNVSYDSDSVRRDFQWRSLRINKYKVKLEKCSKCKLNEGCEGIWRAYYEKYGGSEINPIE